MANCMSLSLLTQTSGKIRVKQRSFVYEYGLPFASRTNKIMQNCYIEWQIGYDAVIDDEKKMALTTGTNINFIGANGKCKTIYELSEYIYYFYQWNIVNKNDLLTIIEYLSLIPDKDLIELNSELSISRTHPVYKKICNIDFEASQVSYPLLIHKFQNYEIVAEIVIKEKQRAAGIQPMLYFCFPITELQFENGNYLVGRKAELKEYGIFVINKQNIDVCLQMIRIFGILSPSHKIDVLHMLKAITN